MPPAQWISTRLPARRRSLTRSASATRTVRSGAGPSSISQCTYKAIPSSGGAEPSRSMTASQCSPGCGLPDCQTPGTISPAGQAGASSGSVISLTIWPPAALPTAPRDEASTRGAPTFKSRCAAVFAAYLRAKGAADADLASRAGLDWTILRPGRLTNEPGTGLVRLAERTGPGTVPHDDVAAVLLALLDTPASGMTLELVAGDTPVDKAVRAITSV